MNLISRGIRNAFRNVTRTVALVVILGLSIGLSLAMLVAHQAVGNKINSLKSTVDNTISISPAGVRGFEGGGNPLTTAQLAKVKALAHVTALDESLSDRLTSSNTSLKSSINAGSLGQRFAQRSGESFSFNGSSGSFSGPAGNGTFNFTPPVTVTGTTDPTNLDSADTQGGGTFKLTSGQVFTDDSTADVALVGKALASKNNLKVGSTFTAYGTKITVIGIFDAGNTFSNGLLIMPLATVQKLSGQSGDITSATATVDSVSNLSSVTSAIKNTLGSSADVTNSAQQAQATVQPLKNIQTISLYSLIGAVAAGAIIILMTMVMIVRERRREIGVIKAIGASNAKVVGQFMSEAVTLTLLAAVVGIIVGAVAGSPITNTLVSNNSSTTSITISASGGRFTAPPGGGTFGGRFGGGVVRRGLGHSLTNVHAVVGWSIIGYGLLAALVIAILGSAIASFFIAKVRPAEVMRIE